MSCSDSTWEYVSSARQGGTVAALCAAVAGDGPGVVFAATPAGVRRSTDYGHSWSVAGTTHGVPFAEAVVASPTFAQDRTVLAGAADALYQSTDRGDTWRRILLGRVLAIAAAPGTWLIGTESDGVLRSENAGRRWTGANAGLLDLTVTALALSPDFERDRLGFAGTTSGLYRTRNGARAWRAVDTDVDEPAIQCVAISPGIAEDRLVLAGTEAHGLLRSDDAGTTWQVVPDLLERSVTALAFGPDHMLAAATDIGVALSEDSGRTWRLVGAELGPILALLFARPPEGPVLLAGLARHGLARSSDRGATWTTRTDNLNASLLVTLALTPSFATDRTLRVAGPQEGVSLSTDAGRTWHAQCIGLGDASVLALAVGNAASVFAATPSGLFRAPVAQTSWQPCLAEPVRAVAADPRSPMVVAATSGGLRISSDNGDTWAAAELGGGLEDAEFIAVALAPDRTIFAATARPSPDGGAEVVVWRSQARGQALQWQRWLVDRAAGGVVPIVVSPAYARDEALFVGLDSRVLHPIRHTREVRAGERRPLWRGTPVGADPGSPVTALAVSHAYPTDRTVFAATSAGVFISSDGAETFHAWSEGLPQLGVVALAAVSPGLVYALCLGGTLWRRHYGHPSPEGCRVSRAADAAPA